MGRTRKNKADKWMPDRVYRGKSAYEYRPKGGGAVRLCPLDAPRSEVLRAYEALTAPQERKRDIAWLVDLYFKSERFLRLAQRTQQDYRENATKILAVFGAASPAAVLPGHCQQYLDKRGEQSKVRANREIAFLSTVYGWAYKRAIVQSNPCLQVEYHRETARKRYVTNAEYKAVYDIAPAPVQVAMEIAYLCAARQGDVLKIKFRADAKSTAHVVEQGIYIRQGKTGKEQVKLWTPRLRAAVERARTLHKRKGAAVVSAYVVHTRDGRPYTRAGFKTLWQRAVDAAIKAGTLAERFTYHDLKARGVSDFQGDKQKFSGHKTASQVARYNRGIDETETVE